MPLTVYAIETGDEVRRIVAATSKARAAKLLQITSAQFKAHATESHRDDELALALSDPGAVWMTHPMQEGWQQVASSRKARMLPPHGGPRAGAGKPRVAKGLAKNRTVRLDDESWKQLCDYGSSKFVRAMLALGLTACELRELEARGGDWLREQLAKPARKPSSRHLNSAERAPAHAGAN